MASGKLLKQLFRNYRKHDYDGFHSTALQIIQEEQQKNHNILARDLLHILENGNGPKASTPHMTDFQKLPKDRERGTILVDARTPDRYFPDMVLDDDLRKKVDLILCEYHKRSVLKTYGLQPRRKMLFTGPPGCGKTLCAEVIAGELGLPLLYTRFDSVISSYLGETASNLRKVFEFASNGTWVVFFDEFDAIGKSRDNTSEHGELKRVVNTFLQLLDNFHSDSMFIAATNHEQLLDKALWRRFDDILYFDLPTEDQIHKLVQIKLRGIHHKSVELNGFISKMVGWSHSDIERVCFEAAKICVIDNHDEITNSIFQEAITRQGHRMELIRKTQE